MSKICRSRFSNQKASKKLRLEYFNLDATNFHQYVSILQLCCKLIVNEVLLHIKHSPPSRLKLAGLLLQSYLLQ